MAIFPFQIQATTGAARAGVLKTPRGDIRTPAFMPVGTAGTVKALYTHQVKAAGADVILCNTYHLMLRPGAERVCRLGGVHAFAKWDAPILTDSGGFQIWSLKRLRKVDADGVTFRSHIDGCVYRLTPAQSVGIQAEQLGSDIVMQLDECTNWPVTYEAAARSMDLSLSWGKKSLHAFGEREKQTIFGIVQGSTCGDLRRYSAEAVAAQGFGGIAIGGLAVGEGHEAMCETLDLTVPYLPVGLPRYAMGVGKPVDLVESVARGVDMFDCVLPTRAGRHGQAWTWDGPLNLKKACFADDTTPLDEQVDCPASRDYSRAYLHHLVKSGETLGAMVLSWHNIAFFSALMARIRQAIADGTFDDLHMALRARWAATRSQPARPA